MCDLAKNLKVCWATEEQGGINCVSSYRKAPKEETWELSIQFSDVEVTGSGVGFGFLSSRF